jgi:hypothetical protein
LGQGITIISRPIGRIKGNTYVNIEGNANENLSQDQNEIKNVLKLCKPFFVNKKCIKNTPN